MAPIQPLLRQPSCLGLTCMKWAANGELSDVDQQLILERLAEVDADAAAVRNHAASASHRG